MKSSPQTLPEEIKDSLNSPEPEEDEDVNSLERLLKESKASTGLFLDDSNDEDE
jgi:hypothetical protein